MEAIANITTTRVNLAEGQVAGQFKVSIMMSDLSGQQMKLVDAVPVTDSEGNPTGEYAMPPVTFDNLVPGDYTVLASRCDQNGNDIVTAVSNTFTIAEPAPVTQPTPEQADVPASVTITFA